MPVLDRENCEDVQYVHLNIDCDQVVVMGPRGGLHYPSTYNLKVSSCHLWKRRPNLFEIVARRGMFGRSVHIDNAVPTGDLWHTGRSEECELGTLRDSIDVYGAMRFANGR